MNKPINPAEIFPVTPTADIDGIGRMLDGCGTDNRNDLLIIAIEALIDGGVNTGPDIVSAAVALGFKPSHAGKILSASQGTNPNRHRWQRGVNGVYCLHLVTLAA